MNRTRSEKTMMSSHIAEANFIYFLLIYIYIESIIFEGVKDE